MMLHLRESSISMRSVALLLQLECANRSWSGWLSWNFQLDKTPCSELVKATTLMANVTFLGSDKFLMYFVYFDVLS